MPSHGQSPGQSPCVIQPCPPLVYCLRCAPLLTPTSPYCDFRILSCKGGGGLFGVVQGECLRHSQMAWITVCNG